ncbi:hypothetical protein AruPA_06420 [Acidiphilium sp. PA]|uniref:hypothetical protein n=1 Tax=Acidiphilium sp. PA TaxID=2871705 RepID=UPI0022443DD3|nr:hypothetical protein [Acidiphilium sp. PA]MCW8306664.1 hypothetical protein [Acidiphilium sp. PA]
MRPGQKQYGALARLGVAGQRLNAKVPYGHCNTMIFSASSCCDRVDAPFVFGQPINLASCTIWIKRQLCPTVRPGNIVVQYIQPQKTRH